MKYLKTRQIQDRYDCSPGTARKYMRQMEHQEKPLRVTSAAADAWDASRTVGPAEHPRRKARITGDYRIRRDRPA